MPKICAEGKPSQPLPAWLQSRHLSSSYQCESPRLGKEARLLAKECACNMPLLRTLLQDGVQCLHDKPEQEILDEHLVARIHLSASNLQRHVAPAPRVVSSMMFSQYLPSARRSAWNSQRTSANIVWLPRAHHSHSSHSSIWVPITKAHLKYMAMGQNPAPPVNIPTPTKIY